MPSRNDAENAAADAAQDADAVCGGLLFRALKACCAAHEGQTDKAGMPYWQHCLRTMLHMQWSWPESTEAELACALLHDVIEDTDYRLPDDLQLACWRVLVFVTRGKGQSYEDYIAGIISSKNQTAMRVKFCDLADNMDPARRANISELQYKRYFSASLRLHDAMEVCCVV